MAGRVDRGHVSGPAMGASALAALGVVAAVVLHPKLLLYLVILAAIFVPAEAWRAVRRHRAFPAGTLTDLTHLAVNRVFGPMAFAGVAVVLGFGARVLVPSAVRSTVDEWPFAVQFSLALALAELSAYWSHRWMHRIPWLWRFHKVHHTIEEMGWVAGSRQHPVDWAFSAACAAVPMLALGLPAGIFGVYALASGFWSVLVHSNVRIRFGPLRHVVVTPEFHHWHHSDRREAYSRNYAAQFAFLDRVFGTLNRPDRVWPGSYGVGEVAPRGWLAQFTWPFRSPPRVGADSGG